MDVSSSLYLCGLCRNCDSKTFSKKLLTHQTNHDMMGLSVKREDKTMTNKEHNKNAARFGLTNAQYSDLRMVARKRLDKRLARKH